MHYVLHKIETGELVRVSEVPFQATEIGLGEAVEFFDTDLPNQEEYYWNPKFLMWRRSYV